MNNIDKNNTAIEIAEFWKNESKNIKYLSHSNEEAESFKTEFIEGTSEKDYEILVDFCKSLNSRGIVKTFEKIIRNCDLPQTDMMMDNQILKWLKEKFPNLEISSLESEEEEREMAEIESLKESQTVEYSSETKVTDKAEYLTKEQADIFKYLAYVSEKLLNNKPIDIEICQNVDCEKLQYIQNNKEASIRNKSWSEKLKDELFSDAKIIVCAGDYHMIGENSLFNLLFKEGYSINMYEETGNLLNFDYLMGQVIHSDNSI